MNLKFRLKACGFCEDALLRVENIVDVKINMI